MKKWFWILWAFPALLQAQTDSLSLNEVILMDNRIPAYVHEAGMQVNIISQEQIRQLPVRNVQELLQYIAGVDFRQCGPGGTQADVGIRGGTFDQTLILWNGIKINDPQTGHHSLNFGMDINLIVRVEVLKGPAASRYGMNAHSGVINIITRPPSKFHIAKGVSFSTDPASNPRDTLYAGYDSWLGIGFNTGKATHYLSGQHLRSTGHRAFTDVARNTFLWQSVIPTSKAGIFQGQASWVDNQFGASGYYAYPADSNSEERVRTYQIALQHEITWKKWTFRTKGYVRHNVDTYTFRRYQPTYFQNRHTNQVNGAEIHASYPHAYGILGIGYEFREERINSNNLGQRLRSIHGIFIENRWKSSNERYFLNTGAYLNVTPIWGVQLFPSIDFNFRMTANIRLYARYAESMRAPTFTDLYYTSHTNLGNPNLQPEFSKQGEAGVKWIQRNHQFQAGVFLTHATNMIDWIRDSLTQPWQVANYEQVKGTGVDATYRWKGKFAILPFASIGDVQLGYTFLDLNLIQGTGKISRYALSNMKHQVVFQATVFLMKHMKFTASTRYSERMGGASIFLLDTRFNYDIGLARMFVDFQNITNHKYVKAGNALMPGRWLRIGFQMDVK